MKYSYSWIQSHIEDPLPSPEVLKETIIFKAFEVEETEVVGGDTIFDIKVLPDRAGDCLSHHGMAREVSGLLDLNFNDIAYTMPPTTTEVSIDVQTPLCARYSAVRIDGVHVAPSPEWLVKKLAAVGQRSINNVVDATNFILLDLGQPTHAFDADKVHGSIVVRHATEGECITTLSNEEKVLNESMMVIADGEKALAIAGVKGGNAAEVSLDTTSIILEIANFDPVSVRKTSRGLGLVTDASKRFENNLAPYAVEAARAKLVGLVTLLAGGTVIAMGEHYPETQVERALSFTLADMQQRLGNTITDASIVKVLDRYGYTYEKSDDFYTIAVPLWRHDITGAHDMAEEIGRVIGYDIIPSAPLPFTPTTIVNEQYEKIRAIKAYLLSEGYSEVMTYSFRKKGDVYISHGPKDKSALRTNLSDALKESYEMNKLNAALLGMQDIKIFEVGTVFTESTETINIATASKDGIKECAVEEFVIPEGATGSIPAAVSAPFSVWSSYPFITRDIAVWVSDEDKQLLETIVADFAAAHCARPATLFDTFSKEGKTSLAYRLVFQSKEKTLTDTEVEPIFQKLVGAIAAHAGMQIR
ncbi:MAG: phenylalanine--tRNA ligase subunit beta [Patescibacteria group bacterium]